MDKKEYRLDKKDREILYHLSLNARVSVSEIAKQLSLSNQVVGYRIKNLEKNGIIRGYYAIINYFKLGLNYYRVHIKYRNLTRDDERGLITCLSSNPSISSVMQLHGTHDLIYNILAKDIFDFEKINDGLNKKYGYLFEDRQLSLGTRIYHYKNRFLLDKDDMSEVIVNGDLDCKDINALDSSLLRELSINGRMPLIELSRKLGISPKIIKWHINKLVKAGIIKGFDLRLNHGLLGYTHSRITLNLKDGSDEEIKKIINYFKMQRQIIKIIKSIGLSDIELDTMTKTNEELHDLLLGVKYNFGKNIKHVFSNNVYSQLLTN